MTKLDIQQSMKPPASGIKVQAAIEQALKSLDAQATSRLRNKGKWRHGPLVWKVMLEMSLDAAANGIAPSIRKHDLAFQLKRSSGEHVEVDHVLWKRFLSFHQQYKSRLHEGALKLGLPTLALERVTNNGLGGDPDKTEAIFWLCFDADTRSEKLPSGPKPTPAAAEQTGSSAALQEPILAKRDEADTPELRGDQARDGTEPDGRGAQRTPTEPAEDSATADAARNTNEVLGHQASASEFFVVWLATLRSQATTSSSTPVAVIVALALLLPVLGGAATEILSPVQALTDSIAALVGVFNDLMVIRT